MLYRASASSRSDVAALTRQQFTLMVPEASCGCLGAVQMGRTHMADNVRAVTLASRRLQSLCGCACPSPDIADHVVQVFVNNKLAIDLGGVHGSKVKKVSALRRIKCHPVVVSLRLYVTPSDSKCKGLMNTTGRELYMQS